MNQDDLSCPPTTRLTKDIRSTDETLDRLKKPLEESSPGESHPLGSANHLTWYKTGEQLLEAKHPIVPTSTKLDPSSSRATPSPISITPEKTEQPLEAKAESSLEIPGTLKRSVPKAKINDAHLSDEVAVKSEPIVLKENGPTPATSETKPWDNTFLTREKHILAPISITIAYPTSNSQVGPYPQGYRAPQPMEEARPRTTPYTCYDGLTPLVSRLAATKGPYYGASASAVPRTMPQTPQYRGSLQQTNQNWHPPRPRTPGGTVIMLPANAETAYYAGLEINGVVDVNRLARWSKYNSNWAEYLRSGGGNEEAWWLYRRMKGFPGYRVSGWHELYEEREQDARITRR